MKTTLKIDWKFSLAGYFNENVSKGEQTTTEEFGYVNGQIRFVRFRVWEKQTSNFFMDYKITHQTILPL